MNLQIDSVWYPNVCFLLKLVFKQTKKYRKRMNHGDCTIHFTARLISNVEIQLVMQ